MIGKLHDHKTMFFRVGVGQATENKTGITYEFSTNVGGSCPIVRNKKNGRWFTLTWPDIVELAKQAGIDAPVKKGRP